LDEVVGLSTILTQDRLLCGVIRRESDNAGLAGRIFILVQVDGDLDQEALAVITQRVRNNPHESAVRPTPLAYAGCTLPGVDVGEDYSHSIFGTSLFGSTLRLYRRHSSRIILHLVRSEPSLGGRRWNVDGEYPLLGRVVDLLTGHNTKLVLVLVALA
jgi:hypothetical protein